MLFRSDKYESFVLGQNEYFRNGEIRHTPPTIRSRNVVRNINVSGTLEGWQNCMRMFGDPGYEWHAFAVLCGMASPLIEFTNVNGVILSLYGETGFGKTGALYGGLSIWGHPERLAVYDATSNGLIGRMITCKNILYGLDEQGNRDGHTISHIAHNISSGQPKLRMSGSDNSERDVAFVTKLLAILTTNHRLKDIMSTYKGDTKAEEMRVLEPNLRRPNHPGYELTDERGYEMFEMLTLVQCRKAKPVPIILYGSEFWHSLINFSMLADLGTISEQDLALLRFVDSPQEAWNVISSFYNL